jgi:hypothetical protein
VIYLIKLWSEVCTFFRTLSAKGDRLLIVCDELQKIPTQMQKENGAQGAAFCTYQG